MYLDDKFIFYRIFLSYFTYYLVRVIFTNILLLFAINVNSIHLIYFYYLLLSHCRYFFPYKLFYSKLYLSVKNKPFRIYGMIIFIFNLLALNINWWLKLVRIMQLLSIHIVKKELIVASKISSIIKKPGT